MFQMDPHELARLYRSSTKFQVGDSQTQNYPSNPSHLTLKSYRTFLSENLLSSTNVALGTVCTGRFVRGNQWRTRASSKCRCVCFPAEQKAGPHGL